MMICSARVVPSIGTYFKTTFAFWRTGLLAPPHRCSALDPCTSCGSAVDYFLKWLELKFFNFVLKCFHAVHVFLTLQLGQTICNVYLVRVV